MFHVARAVAEAADVGRCRASARLRPRHEVRYPVNRPVQLSTWVGQSAELIHPIDAWCQDISYAGVGLLTTEALKPSSVQWLELSSLTHSPASVPFIVVRCTQLVPGIYSVGGEFGQGR